jgi:hypothetical protein
LAASRNEFASLSYKNVFQRILWHDACPLVGEYVDGQDNVDLGNLAALTAESLVDLILLAPEEERGNLFAATVAHLGQMFLVKSGAVEGGSATAH